MIRELCDRAVLVPMYNNSETSIRKANGNIGRFKQTAPYGAYRSTKWSAPLGEPGEVLSGRSR